MKYNPSENFVTGDNCRYRHNGRRLSEIRGAELKRLAAQIGIKPEDDDYSTWNRNKVLGHLMAHFNSLKAPDDVTDLFDPKPVTKKTKKKAKKKK